MTAAKLVLLPILEFLFVAIITLVLPSLSYFSYQKIKPLLQQDVNQVRLPLYYQSFGIHAVLLGLVLVFWYLGGRDWSELGLRFDLSVAQAWGVTTVLILLIYQGQKWLRIQSHENYRQEQFNKLEEMPGVELAPYSNEEKKVFIWLSVSAGICEESFYRGFLMAYLSHWFDQTGVVLLSSLLFAFAHGTQGLKGVFYTGLAGLLLALVFVYTQSLLVPVVFHALMNITTGLLVWNLKHSR